LEPPLLGPPRDTLRQAAVNLQAFVQLELPFLLAPPLDPAIEFVRVRRAKRYIMRVRPDGSLRVTVPRGGSRAEAMKFVERHLHWVLEERLKVSARHAPVRWTLGSTILLNGEFVTILAQEGVTPGADLLVSYGPRSVVVPGGTQDLRPFIEAGLRQYARETLTPRLFELADRHGLCVARVSIRNQRSRWGSCSRTGAIALNFRLVQMPPTVRDYVLLHELMHLKQQNHGVRFWRLVEAACPDFRAAEQWLKTDGRALF
jgi:predicted metal-dependent hydrolase